MASPQRPVVRLIGLGNIGFRHLQGLKPLAGSIHLEARDRSDEAVARAEAEWSAYAGAQGDFSSDGTRDGPADLVVLATSAMGRAEILQDQLNLGAKRLLLEKVVFTETAAFERAQAQLERAGAVAFVNTARRLWPLHRKLKEMAVATGPVHLDVEGRGLGLACNGVHFIDLLQMLSGETDLDVVAASISEPWASKREGYYETWGRLKLETPGGSTLCLSVLEDSSPSPQMSVRMGERDLIINEAEGRVTDSTGAEIANLGRSPYQSELSAAYATPMLAGSQPELPSLSVSAEAHRVLFDVLAPVFQKEGLIGPHGLPIT